MVDLDVCEGSDQDIKNFVKVVCYCAEKYHKSGVFSPRITNDELQDALNLSELSARKVGWLLRLEKLAEPETKNKVMNGWSCNLTKNIAPYAGIKTFHDYLHLKELINYLDRGLYYRSRNQVNRSAISNPAPFIEKVAETDPADIQKTTANLMFIDNDYYLNALRQSQLSFMAAIGAGITGIVFFIAAVIIALIIYAQSKNASYAGPIITACSGGVVEVIAGIILVIHSRALDQANQCHNRLNRIQRFLVATSHCENLEGDLKQTTRAKLMEKLND